MVQVGGFWGAMPALRAAIETSYCEGSGRERYRADYLAACDRIERWAAGGYEVAR